VPAAREFLRDEGPSYRSRWADELAWPDNIALELKESSRHALGTRLVRVPTNCLPSKSIATDSGGPKS
jgi:hypothetical protein